MHLTHPFAPVFDTYSRVLILGSFPSVISRDEQFYYAYSRNRFWRILSALFAPEIDISIQIFLLPSSSPANARYSYKKLVESWQILREYALLENLAKT
ncbi:MAG TPA: hypothetical protein DEQ48_04555 [Helicobacter sp.]|uniref:G:T/U mismatch-specific uracil/thymine DNA-glycosylase n=1 Tax=Helicobacter typhlonius TaxID=76936 RepID=A0A4U8RYX6_9HELI|nr:hypothetical protein LS75_005370 [Helicobacter typhlonius]TLD88891.1 hypothetical protein LS67_003640 [Helicobacter sp. MIT 03-1616]HCD73478.1 hypothetical protein [Helicobacter sp.]